MTVEYINGRQDIDTKNIFYLQTHSTQSVRVWGRERESACKRDALAKNKMKRQSHTTMNM